MRLASCLTLVALFGCSDHARSAAARDAGGEAGATADEFDSNLAKAYATPGSFSTRFSQLPGAYVWGGVLDASVTSARPLAGSVDVAAATAGFKTVRIALTPYMDDASDYKLAITPKPAALVDLLAVPEVDATLRNPALDLVTLTTFDFTSDFPTRNRFLEKTFLVANQRAIFAEYVGFFETLLRKYKGTGKTFVVANWEGDNTIFCGDVAKYGVSDAAVHECEATLADHDLKARVDAFTLWNAIRKAAVLAARARVGSDTDVTLSFAIELNQIHLVDANAWPTTLSAVIPTVKPDLALYSAYESTGSDRIVPDLVEIRRQLDAKGLSTTRIGIGELGINGPAATQTRKIRQELSGIVSGTTDVALVYLWNAVNPVKCDAVHPDPAMSCWGLYQPDGSPFVAPYAGKLVPDLGPAAVTAQLSAMAGKSTLTVPGQFPGAIDKTKLEVFANCAGGTGHSYESLIVTSASPSQLTVTLPKHLEGKTCSLRVHSDFGLPSEWSPPFLTK